MEDKKINKQLRHQFSALGWTLVVYFALMYFLTMVTMAVDIAKQYLGGFASGDYSMTLDYDAIASNATGCIVTVVVGIVILWAWKGTDYWKTEILKKEAPMKASVFFLLVILGCGAQVIFSLWVEGVEAVMNLFDRSVMDLMESVSGDSNSVSMFLYASILGPISEEILFRGLVLRSLKPYGKRFAIFTSALLFALFHGNILQVPFAFLMGLLLGYAAAEYSIIWSIVLHIFNNLVVADLMTRLLKLLPTTTADILSALELVVYAIAAVAVLVVKRREIRAYHQGEGMDRRCLKWFFLNSGMLIFIIIVVINMLSMLAMA